MDETLERMLDLFGLTEKQREAAAERGQTLAVTAGAGSGKTRTLVARYLGLLANGLQPRQVAAITFTEKAAREMRSRARQSLRRLVLQAVTLQEQQLWTSLDAQMDSARIGTIHSLCAEILRSHPAEARLDPRAVVIEENQSAALRAAALTQSLTWAVQEESLAALFRVFNLGALERLLAALLSKRLELAPESFDSRRSMVEIQPALAAFLQDERAGSIRRELLRKQTGGSLAGEAGDGMAVQAADLLSLLDTAEKNLSENDVVGCAAALFQARREKMGLKTGKRDSPVKDAVRELRDRYDLLLQPWLGGQKAADLPPDRQVEAAVEEALPQLGRLFQQTLDLYRASLDELSGLDFDDLEAGTVTLLRIPAIRAYWQKEVAAVLVDEFQDTNARQREIILALAGDQPGRLFVVGDARQSIYRFRGADVTVFTGLQSQIQSQGGRTIDLERTFRAHPVLLESMGGLLKQAMGSDFDPQQPYRIPFSPLKAVRKEPRPGTRAPFVECILAGAENALAARPVAAQALARRLNELKAGGEIHSWEDVALLFRASTTFPLYEQALEEAGVPFVTVAGSGFYDRPEVRDLLNMLRALSDPWDDQALAGLLRSPAFGISDAGLYRLRCPPEDNGALRPLRRALVENLDDLSGSDRVHAQRASRILDRLETLVDRLPVAELLQRLVEQTDYRATLASCAAQPGSARLWRNVDKLIGDAQTSGLVRVRAFLEFITTLRDVGAREGEAAPEAEGALRLMTIHKSKGLEFPFVVLADASRRRMSGSEPAFRLGEAWTAAPDKLENSPLGYRLARWQDSLQADAEDLRLLYVALTRAQEKLIINGHLTYREGRASADGWLGLLLEAGGLLPDALVDKAGERQVLSLPLGGEWSVWLAPPGAEGSAGAEPPLQVWPESKGAALFAPLVKAIEGEKPAEHERPQLEPAEHERDQLDPAEPSPRVIGEMVHKALQRWCFPGDPALEGLLRAQAQAGGLLEESLIQNAIGQSRSLLLGFQRHALYSEMQRALERYHELPYLGDATNPRESWGFMDCLYRTPNGWVLVDFKTDKLDDLLELDPKILKKYEDQLLRYRWAAQELVGAAPHALLVFLNVKESVEIWEIPVDT